LKDCIHLQQLIKVRIKVLAADSSYTNNINLKSFTKHFFKYKVWAI